MQLIDFRGECTTVLQGSLVVTVMATHRERLVNYQDARLPLGLRFSGCIGTQTGWFREGISGMNILLT